MDSWFGSSSQTLLLINCPCFIYILKFGVIFPRWSRMGPNLPGSTCPQTLILILSEQEPWYLNQWSRVLWRALFWSREHLEVRIFEKSLEMVGKASSLPSLSKWLVAELWLLASTVGFNPALCWQESKVRALGKFRCFNKTSALKWSVSEKHLVPTQYCPIGCSAMTKLFSLVLQCSHMWPLSPRSVLSVTQKLNSKL